MADEHSHGAAEELQLFFQFNLNSKWLQHWKVLETIFKAMVLMALLGSMDRKGKEHQKDPLHCLGF